jgi:hypothetical protein
LLDAGDSVTVTEAFTEPVDGSDTNAECTANPLPLVNTYTAPWCVVDPTLWVGAPTAIVVPETATE